MPKILESSKMHNFGRSSVKWCPPWEKNGAVPFWTMLSVLASQKNLLPTLRKWKVVFLWNKLESSFGNIVCHHMMHACAKFGPIWRNYVTNVAKTLLLWLESYECSFEIASFCEHFFNESFVLPVYIFLVTRSRIMMQRVGFPFFWFFLISYGDFKIRSN